MGKSGKRAGKVPVLFRNGTPGKVPVLFRGKAGKSACPFSEWDAGESACPFSGGNGTPGKVPVLFRGTLFRGTCLGMHFENGMPGPGCPCRESRPRERAQPGGRKRSSLGASGGHGWPKRASGDGARATRTHQRTLHPPLHTPASVRWGKVPVLFRFLKSACPFSFFFVFREIFRESGWQGNPDEGELFWKSRYPVPLRLFE